MALLRGRVWDATWRIGTGTQQCLGVLGWLHKPNDRYVRCADKKLLLLSTGHRGDRITSAWTSVKVVAESYMSCYIRVAIGDFQYTAECAQFQDFRNFRDTAYPRGDR